MLRPPDGAGQYKDTDAVRMLELLSTPQAAQQHAPLFNQLMFAPDGKSGGSKRLDADWRGANGLKGLRYDARERRERTVGKDCVWLHVVAHLNSG